MKNKITLLNMVSGLLLQLCTIISGFVVPQIILSYFGSEVNGLISSLNQFLSYVALAEGGLTGVVAASLYKPLVEKDTERISSVLVTARAYYVKIGWLFIGYSIALSVIYPMAINTQFDVAYVALLTIILSMTLFIQYMFSLTMKTLLDADKKAYIVSLTQCVIIILNVILTYIAVHIFPQIHLLKLITGLLFIIQPLVYRKFVNDNYEINWKAKRDNSLIKNRWDGFAINIAAFVHVSTDIVILTLFTDLKTVSIYSVYSLVTNGLKQMINTISASIIPTVGRAYAKGDYAELHEKLDMHEYIIFMLVGFCFCMAALLITPFVLLYTAGVTDTNYNHVLFGILLSISEALYLVKAPHLGLAYSANKFKEISIPAYIEALLNIVISILLVYRCGLIGVAIGTIVGMLYRMIFHVYYTSTLIEKRPQRIFYKKFFGVLLTVIAAYTICRIVLPPIELSVIEWIWYAVVYAIIILTLMILLSWVLFRKELIYIMRYLFKKK